MKSKQKSFNFKFFSIILLIILAIGSIIFVILQNYGENSNEKQELILVKASKEPYKIKPSDPGGMHVPNMDKRVYDNISATKNPVQKERLLPLPEEPLTINAFAAVEETKVNDVKKIEVKEEKIVPLKEVKIESKIAKKIENGFKIQLAAFKTEKEATNMWSKIQEKHSNLLKNLDFEVKMKDLGKKGQYHALQAGPIASASNARLICKKLIEKKQGCFVVK